MNTVEISWESPKSKQIWTVPCTVIIEHFGVPGEKYTTTLTSDTIFLHFKDSKDALVCRLLISDYQ